MTAQPPARRRFLLVTAAMAVALAACSSGAAPAASSPPSSGPGPTTTPTSDPAGGGSSDGNVGGGAVIVDPGQPVPVDPAAGQPTIVIPKPGQKNPHPVSPATLQASVDGRHVLVKVTWWSGVEPCNVLDSVKVDRSGTDIAISLVEGAADLDAMCTEQALLKATIVDLGDLEPGTYTVRAPKSEAIPIQVTVS
jgi:hypothetical protein